MTEPQCIGDGSGWGTIDGTRLRVLMLIDTDHAEEAQSITRALRFRHHVETCSERGLFRSVLGARAARTLQPHLVHAIGVGGVAASVGTIASGVRVPFLLSLTLADLEGASSKRALARVAEARAVLVDEGRVADHLRALGVTRELYVLAPPPSAEHELPFLGALEVVYGRSLAGRELEGDVEPKASTAAATSASPTPRVELVQIGRVKS